MNLKSDWLKMGGKRYKTTWFLCYQVFALRPFDLRCEPCVSHCCHFLQTPCCRVDCHCRVRKRSSFESQFQSRITTNSSQQASVKPKPQSTRNQHLRQGRLSLHTDKTTALQTSCSIGLELSAPRVAFCNWTGKVVSQWFYKA